MSLLVVAALGVAGPATAHWNASGSGSASGTAATMPSGQQPAGTASGQSVTVVWSQSVFLGAPLGTVNGGGYRVARYPQGSSIPAVVGTACGVTITGPGDPLQCVESGVPYGSWEYTVTPVLGGSFTGAESLRSAAVAVATTAPLLTAAVASNPAPGQSTGAVQLTWATVTGATGFNVYRRVSGGAFDFSSPVNGGTPLGAVTSYEDAGGALSAGTTYDYVVRAVAGTPAVESASSNALSATAIGRPAAPAGSVSAVAAPAARIDVSWSAVSGAAGYNVYRRTTAGSFDFASPLNGATPSVGTGYADTTAVNGTGYVYVVRTVVLGAGGAQVESVSSSASATATADGVAPSAPTALSVNSGGNVLGSALCSIASGTRYVNAAGRAAVQLTATIPAPAVGDSVVFTATSTGSTPVSATVAATGTSVTATLNLTALVDGTLTVTAASRDAAGNLSATAAPTNAVIKDVAAPALTAVYNLGVYALGVLVTPYSLSGTSECGASIRASETVGPNVGKLFPVAAAHQIASGATYSFTVDGALLTTYRYDVTATDLAGNASAAVNAGN